jgi:hypothetical protein
MVLGTTVKKLLLSTEGAIKILICYAGFWVAGMFLDHGTLETTVYQVSGILSLLPFQYGLFGRRAVCPLELGL